MCNSSQTNDEIASSLSRIFYNEEPDLETCYRIINTLSNFNIPITYPETTSTELIIARLDDTIDLLLKYQKYITTFPGLEGPNDHIYINTLDKLSATISQCELIRDQL